MRAGLGRLPFELAVLVVAALSVTACSAPTGTQSETTQIATSRVISETTTTVTAPAVSATTTAAPVPEWQLVSVTAALPEGFSDGLAQISGVRVVSTVRVGTIHLVESRTANGEIVDDTPAGYVLPLEAQVFDSGSHAEFVPPTVARLLTRLENGEAILSQSSAAFRGLVRGSRLVLEDGTALRVIGVVADEWIGAAEVVLSSGDAERLGVTTERYSIILYDGPRAELERLANETTDASVRVRSRDQVDVFRHADAVAAQIAIKDRFGEFAYRPLDSGKVEIDSVWKEAHIVRERLPLLGVVTCHVEFVEMLREALEALEEAGHDDAFDRRAFAGCWYPRLIRKRTDLSRHAWGVAADINFWNPADGSAGAPDDPRLIEVMDAVDILSGHAWTDPGPGHFEWYGPVGESG